MHRSHWHIAEYRVSRIVYHHQGIHVRFSLCSPRSTQAPRLMSAKRLSSRDDSEVEGHSHGCTEGRNIDATESLGLPVPPRRFATLFHDRGSDLVDVHEDASVCVRDVLNGGDETAEGKEREW